jgi:hypothetical protein
MPLMKPPHDTCVYNGCKPKPGAFVDVLPRDVAALELEGWQLAGDITAPVAPGSVIAIEEVDHE